MFTIKWRKWNLEDVYLICARHSSLHYLTNNIPYSKINKKIENLINILLEENKNNELVHLDTTLFGDFKQHLLTCSLEDVPQIAYMLEKLKHEDLILPAPLVIPDKNRLKLIDGNHRSILAKRLNIPIKAQIIEETKTSSKIKSLLVIAELNLKHKLKELFYKRMEEN